MSTGPTTRKRTSPQRNNNTSPPGDTAKNLPPPRTQRMLRTVSPPLSNTRLSRIIYLLVGLTALLCTFYTYRLVQHKRDVGGWWNLALGKHPNAYADTQWPSQGADSSQANRDTRASGRGRGREGEVEDRINALADALGMPSKELASAIAGAVRAYVPPASLSSVAAKETGEAVKVLLKKAASGEEDTAEHANEQDGSPGVVEGIMQGVESFAGMDEPTL